MTGFYDGAKRGVEVVAASVGLIVTAPLLLVIAALVRWDLGSPVLFRQLRPGKDGRPFEMVKFRTMREASPGYESDEDRITPFGAFLRSTSLDELPELINVLKGDMSLVGPRPLLMQYLPLFTPRQARRHEVRPGITGLAQVKGRNHLSWAERLAWDVYYVDHRGVRLDLQVLAETIKVVLRREGITEEGHVAMTDFEGAEDIEVSP